MKAIEREIAAREARLREWFIRDCDPVHRIIDGLDIGWGGTQRWATRRIPLNTSGMHLDVACGYATFLAQLGWRFPSLQLVGLNLDFAGAHSVAGSLLDVAGVRADLVQADARKLPFPSEKFSSVSCFLGLQDIQIGFGQEGVRQAVAEMQRVIEPKGIIVLLDELSSRDMQAMLVNSGAEVFDRAERALDVRWPREIAEVSIRLYAEGWVKQLRDGQDAAGEAFVQAHARLAEAMNRQLAAQGHYTPFGPLRMIAARKPR